MTDKNSSAKDHGMDTPEAPWRRMYTDAGIEVMPAPNRYRKLFKASGLEGSHALQWFFAAGFDEGSDLRRAALDMMKRDWPEKADRAIGMEPTITLHDVVLLWRCPNA